MIAQIYLLRFFTNKYIDGLITCICTPEESLEREGLRQEPGSIMEINFLKKLYAAHAYFPQFHDDIEAPFFRFNIYSLAPTNILGAKIDTNFSQNESCPPFQNGIAYPKNWEEYCDTFLKVTGTICRTHTSGGIIS
jgi:hypothetical protein